MSQRGLLATSLVLTLAVSASGMAGCAPPATAPGGAAGPPAATQFPPLPTASAEIAPGPAERPAPAITEPRAVELEWPLSVRVGNSDIVRLGLVYQPEGYLTPTAEFEGHETTGAPIEIPNLYDTHSVSAIARLDSVAFEIDRSGDWEQMLLPGESLGWQWTITPRQAGRQVATLSLHLHFVPKAGGETLQRRIWNRTLTIEASTVFGLPGPIAQTLGVFGSVVGTVLGVPFLEKVLAFIWRRARGRAQR